ncbi:MAG: hypothetical protein HQL40_08845 [Alphaproteobacteria bacterium]|nr:hypothetical protein [Alphaproteobacteria bacterium]
MAPRAIWAKRRMSVISLVRSMAESFSAMPSILRVAHPAALLEEGRGLGGHGLEALDVEAGVLAHGLVSFVGAGAFRR